MRARLGPGRPKGANVISELSAALTGSRRTKTRAYYSFKLCCKRGLLTLLLATAAGCSSDFDPPSLLNRLRVLATNADRFEVGPGETVTFRPRVFAPEGVTVTATEWRFCPLSLGSVAGYRCAVPTCEVPLTPAMDGSLTANPSALAASCVATLGSSGDGGLPTGATLPESIETVFRLKLTGSDGDVEEVIERLTLWTTRAPPERNRAPLISAVTVAGAAPDATGRFAPVTEAAKPITEVEVAVQLDPASLDRYTDANGNTFTEDPIVSFYATAGRFKQDRSSGVRSFVKWKVEKLGPMDTEATLYVVTRDLRGGQSMVGPYRIPITRLPAAANSRSETKTN